jgi:hypothetical protein
LAKVDPFVAPIPRKFLNDPETRPFFEYLNRFLHDLYIRTGGGDDAIEDAQNEEVYGPGIQLFDQDELESELDALAMEPLSFDPTELEDQDVTNRRYSLLVG